MFVRSDYASTVQVVVNRMAEGAKTGEVGFLLDGFPRTRAQALALMDLADVQLALNLILRESVSYFVCLYVKDCANPPCAVSLKGVDINIASCARRSTCMPRSFLKEVLSSCRCRCWLTSV